MILLISSDRGAAWASPRQIAPPGSGQWDAQIAVDPMDGRTVYASWLQNNKSDTVVGKSTDGGVMWSAEVDLSTYVAGYSYIQPDGFSFPSGD